MNRNTLTFVPDNPIRVKNTGTVYFPLDVVLPGDLLEGDQLMSTVEIRFSLTEQEATDLIIALSEALLAGATTDG